VSSLCDCGNLQFSELLCKTGRKIDSRLVQDLSGRSFGLGLLCFRSVELLASGGNSVPACSSPDRLQFDSE